MTDEIKSLIYRLNQLANKRKELFDQLWLTETEAQELRTKLLGLLEQSERNKS
jgi:uncharacterized protein YnzC (UPF0291/DUF896 family)